MVLDYLNIRDYKGAHDFEITPGKLSVLVGKIGAGKSSVLEAIRFALTGASDTDTAKADVAIKILGGKEIHRKGRVVKVEGSTTSQDSVRKLLEDGTGVSLEHFVSSTVSWVRASIEFDKWLQERLGLVSAEENPDGSGPSAPDA